MVEGTPVILSSGTFPLLSNEPSWIKEELRARTDIQQDDEGQEAFVKLHCEMDMMRNMAYHKDLKAWQYKTW